MKVTGTFNKKVIRLIMKFLNTLAIEMIDTPRVFRCKHQCFTPIILQSVIDASPITFGS